MTKKLAKLTFEESERPDDRRGGLNWTKFDPLTAAIANTYKTGKAIRIKGFATPNDVQTLYQRIKTRIPRHWPNITLHRRWDSDADELWLWTEERGKEVTTDGDR